MALTLTKTPESTEKALIGQDRITVIDALRGFALFGMVLTHSYDSFWHFTKEEILNADLSVLSPLGRLFDLGADTFLVRKFYTIFSFLFGLGFAIQFQSAKAKGKPIVGRFIWRLLILLAIGLVSQQIIGSGKILQIYAILGLALIFTHKWKDSYLLLASISLFLLNSVVLWNAMQINETAAQVPDSSNLGFLSLKIGQIFSTNSFQWFIGEFFGGRLLMEACLFLFGQYIGRKNIFTNTIQNRFILKKALFWSGSIALASTTTIAFGKIGGLLDSNTISQFVNPDFFFGQIKGLQQISLSFFYVAFIVQLYRTKLFKKPINLLAPAGKMALTTFILQAGLILELNNLRLMHKGGLVAALGIGILLFLFLALFAHLWLSYFKQGPIEWLWKTLTYLKIQPVRNVKAPVSVNV